MPENYRDVFGSGVPGPFLTLTIEWEGRTRDIVALVDTGADMTQIPNITAQAQQRRPRPRQPQTETLPNLGGIKDQ